MIPHHAGGRDWAALAGEVSWAQVAEVIDTQGGALGMQDCLLSAGFERLAQTVHAEKPTTGPPTPASNLQAVLYESKRRVVGPLCMHVLTFLCRESAAATFLLPDYQHDLI